MTAIRICPPAKWGLLEKEPLSPPPPATLPVPGSQTVPFTIWSMPTVPLRA